MSSSKPAVLVVGGAGYIGAHTCKNLATNGLLPVTFDNFSTGHRDFVRYGPLVEGDMFNAGAIAAACNAWGVTAVIHFAASAYVAESIADPAKYYRNNVTGTLNLLEGMRQAGVRDIVFSSTCAVYGQPETLPIVESTPTHPVNPYGASKLMIERILSDFGNAYGLRWIALRYFNAAGADPDGEIGEVRDPEPHLIPRALMTLLGHIDDFQVCGSDYPTDDGSAVRDYIHVADLAEAHRLALAGLGGDVANLAMNLGTGKGFSVKQVLARIEAMTGRALPAVSGPRRPGDPAVLVAAPALAMERIGFKASLSSLDQIIKTAWAWHQKAHPQR
jgi:UDP-glucose-4-epimerase GalE